MKLIASRATLALTGFCLVLSSVPARAVEATQEVSAGVQQTYQNSKGPKQSKFEEYHPAPNGFVIDSYKLDLDWGDYEMSVRAKDVNLLDQSYKMTGGKPGLFSYTMYWDQTPHIYSYSARSAYRQTSDGRLELDRGLTAANFAADGAAAMTAAQATTITNNIANTWAVSPLIPLQIQTEKFGGDFTFHPARDWTVSTGGSQAHRTGTRGLGVTMGGTSWSTELPEPVDHLIHEGYVDVGYAKKDYQLDFRAELSNFHNQIPIMIWDSARTNTDIYGSMGSAHGQMQTWPDNMAQTYTVSGGVELPKKTHFSGQVGLSLWRQDDDLVPYTINGAATTANTGTTFDVRDRNNLPILSAGRKINVYQQMYRLSNHYFDRLRTSLAYRSYILENRSQAVTFPFMYQADATLNAGAVTPERPEFRDDAIEWKGDYELTKTVSVGTGYEFAYKKQSREIDKLNEHKFDIGTTWKPNPDLFVNLSYLLALRRARHINSDAYQNGINSFQDIPGSVRFDLADRNRNQGRLQIQYTKGDSSYATSFRITQDHYRPGRQNLSGFIPQFGDGGRMFQQYGLVRDDGVAGGLDISQAIAKDWSVDAYYECDFQRRIVVDNSSSPNTVTEKGDWTIRATDLSNVGGVAFNWQSDRNNKVTVAYDIISTVGHADPIHNPGAATNGTVYHPLQATKRMTQNWHVKTKHQIWKNLALTTHYQFQKMNVIDYAWNDIPLVSGFHTTNPGAIYMGESQRTFYVHAVALGLDYKF